ncbi:MAG TPA: hypothetical protein VLM40_15470, partial [Gemmata sp.]|nr:hypothetical protein [Gemmata sp.]
LYAAETRIALDTLGAAGQPQVEWKHDVVSMTEPNAGGVTMNGMSAMPGPGFGTPGATWPPSPPPGYGTLAPAPAGFGAVSRAPEGALSPTSSATGGWPPQSGGGGPGMGIPAGAPPIVTILGR